ncbi:MAG: transporter, partial [Bacteroidota bacterium]
MFNWFSTLFSPSAAPDITHSLIALLLTISLGFLVGRFRLGNVSLGVSAVLFVGLLLGHLGYKMDSDLLIFVCDFGLILFVYAIGIQVGPSFFSSLKKEGLKFNVLAIGTVLLGGLTTYTIFRLTNISVANAVGLMSGSVTNTPGLGAAKSTLQEIQNHDTSRLFDDPAIAYAITYPLGVLGLIAPVIGSKLLMTIDFEKERSMLRESINEKESTIIHTKCRITNTNLIGKSLYQIFKELNTHDIIISRLKHSGSKIVFSPSLG